MNKREKVIWGLKAHCETWDEGKLADCIRNPDMCPYRRGDRPGCTSALAADALALLNEQEPRVMTLEELKSIKTWNRNTPPYLWVEDITGRDNRWKYWRAIRESLNLPGTMGVQNYGSKWRVWNLQPTPEQMRDTLWKREEESK